MLEATEGYDQSSEVISALLDAGVDPNEEGEYGAALHGAAERGTAKEVKLLLKKGASPFLLRRAGLYYNQFPEELARSREGSLAIHSVMRYLFGHLSTEDQTRLCIRI